jgi:membrane-bound lytic murein transglycosylase B
MSEDQRTLGKTLVGIIVALLLVAVVLPMQFLRAQTGAPTDPVAARKAQLQAELDALEQQIDGFNGLIEGKQKEASSLERDIAIINAQIQKAQLEIKRRDLAVSQLTNTISVKKESIGKMQDQIERDKQALAESLRQLQEYDKVPIVQIVLSYATLSDYFRDIDNLDSVQHAVQTVAQELRTHIDEEETAKVELEDRRSEEAELRALQQQEKLLQQRKQQQKNQILKTTKGQESEYKKIVAQKQKDAASIRSQLFQLQGSPAISFEKALQYAQAASQKTGVRTAFILGIISQETDLGRNIGQCNLADDEPKYKWDQVMHTRDHAPFKAVTTELGLDINSMPVSCPMRGADGKRVGWGGGMGPAQFIPSTWILYKDQVAAITGHNPPNPWTPQDAFMASGLLLKDNGAVGDRAAEKKAAGKYFAGSNWNSYLGQSYGNQVLAKADDFQDQIDFLNSVASR